MLKHSFVYLSSSILRKSVPFLLLPILTKYLTPNDYGILAIFTIFISIYTAFINMNMHLNISKNFYNVSKQELAVIIGNIFFILIVLTMIYVTITLGFNLYFNEYYTIPSEYFVLIPLIVFMRSVNTFNTTILRNEQRPYMYGFFEVSITIITMLTTIVCLVYLNLGWYSQIVGIVVAGILFSVIGYLYMSKRNYIEFTYSQKSIRSILNISFPLIPHILAGLVIFASDRLFIESMIGLDAVGLYAVGYSFGAIVMIFTDAFLKAWTPWFYKSLSNATMFKKIIIVKYTYLYIIFLFIIVFIISVVAEFALQYIVDKKFYGAKEFIFWVAIGYGVRGVYQIFLPYLVHINKTSFLSICTGIAALLNLLMNYIFINLYGAIGATYATALAFLVSAFLVFIFQQKHYHMPWKIWKV